MTLFSHRDISQRGTPPGVLAAALLFFVVAAYLLVSALLVRLARVAFTTAAWLLGGMETMGPVLYLLTGILALAIGVGLMRLKNWARRLASIVAGVVFVLTIPTISAAVASSQPFAIAREGSKIIVCVVLFRFLNTGDTASAFSSKHRDVEH